MSNRIDELREWIENKDNIKNGNTDMSKEIRKIMHAYFNEKKGALQKLHKKEYGTIPWNKFYESTKNLLWRICNIDGECANIHNKKNKSVEEKIDDYIDKIAKLIHEEKWEDVELSLSNVEKEIVKNIEVKELFYKILTKYIGWHLTVLNRKYNIKYKEKKTNTKDIIYENEELKEVIQALLLYECNKKEGLQKGLQCATNVKDGVIQTIKRENNKKVDSKTFSDFVNQLLKLVISNTIFY